MTTTAQVYPEVRREFDMMDSRRYARCLEIVKAGRTSLSFEHPEIIYWRSADGKLAVNVNALHHAPGKRGEASVIAEIVEKLFEAGEGA